VNLAVSSRGALENQFGADGLALIDAALADYADATGTPSVVVWLDDDEAMGAFGLPAIATADAASVLMSIRSLRRLLPSTSSLFLIGGDTVVPYWRLPNPVDDRQIDPDPIVYTDNPYGADDDGLEACLAPALPVGRLSDSSGGSAEDFAEVIAAVAGNHRHRQIRSGSAAVVNRDWARASDNVVDALPEPVDRWEAPGYEITGASQADLDRRCLYFNLHGFADDPAWQSFDPVRGQFFPVVTPESFDRDYVSGSIVFVENCYGALTIGKNADTSCALRLVQQGAAGCVGATGLAFGSHVAPNLLIENADLLARRFFESIDGGFTLGEALVRARQAFRGDPQTGRADVFTEKTLLQFTLLGDPSL
jgi:hypothetical protein